MEMQPSETRCDCLPADAWARARVHGGVGSRARPGLSDVFQAADWGDEPLIIVPDDTKPLVVHGRAGNTWEYPNEFDETLTYGLRVDPVPYPTDLIGGSKLFESWRACGPRFGMGWTGKKLPTQRRVR